MIDEPFVKHCRLMNRRFHLKYVTIKQKNRSLVRPLGRHNYKSVKNALEIYFYRGQIKNKSMGKIARGIIIIQVNFLRFSLTSFFIRRTCTEKKKDPQSRGPF